MSYTGVIGELPLGGRGLTGTKNIAATTPDQLLDSNNITYEASTLQKEGGALKYNSTAVSGTPRIIGGHEFSPNSSIDRMIIVTTTGSAGEILLDTGGGTFGTKLTTGLSSVNASSPVFVESGKTTATGTKDLFIYTGTNTPQVLGGTGATVAAIAFTPSDWAATGDSHPIGGFVHENRNWAFGPSSRPHYAYYTTATDHQQFASGGVVAIYPGEGDGLIAGASFKGLAVIWKTPKGIYGIDTSSATITNWRVIRLTDAIGIAGPNAWTMIDNDILFMDNEANIQLISAVNAFGDMSNNNLSQIADLKPFLRDNASLTKNNLYQTKMIYYAEKREAHITMASLGATIQNRRLVVDFNGQTPRFRWSDRDVCESIWLRKDSNGRRRPAIGTSGGYVYDLDQESRSLEDTTTTGTSGYNGQFQTAHTDFGYLDPALATKRKNGQFLEVAVEPKGNWNLSVDVLWDGSIVETLQFNMGNTGATLGSFVLDTDVLTENQVINKRKKMTGGGRRFSVIGRNSGDGQDFSVAKMYAHFKPGDER